MNRYNTDIFFIELNVSICYAKCRANIKFFLAARGGGGLIEGNPFGKCHKGNYDVHAMYGAQFSN